MQAHEHLRLSGRDIVVAQAEEGLVRLTFVSDRLALISLPDDAANVRLDRLTPAEREAVLLAADGHSNRSIAALRHTTEATVSKQIGAAYRKLGVSGRRELRAWLAAGDDRLPAQRASRG